MDTPSGPWVDALIDLFIWFVIGAMILYAIGYWAMKIEKAILPSLWIIILCVIAGGVALAAFSRVFGK